MGYAVGLGNVWRFPYLAYTHGGGAFLFAYALMLLFVGLPIFYLELAVGQYGGVGPNKLFGRIAPAAKGVGYAMLFVSFLVCIYYNVIIAWALFYTFAGMKKELPWTYCGHDYNTGTCYKKEQAEQCVIDAGQSLTDVPLLHTYYDNQCKSILEVCTKYGYTLYTGDTDFGNYAMCNNASSGETFELKDVYRRVVPSEDYWNKKVLGLEEDTTWENYGMMQWENVLCLFGAWFIVCLCLIKGVKSSGKVVYFTALFPYVVLTGLLIRAALLDGAKEGIKFYVSPDWSKLKDFKLWSDAATQIFYSLGTSFGGLVTLASYNRFDNNCHRDALIIAFANCLTSVYAGFVTFSFIGYMALESGLHPSEVIQDSTGLTFIVYPDAMTTIPGSPAWSFIFFVMIITLGLDSQFTMTETITTAFMDEWPRYRKKKSLVVIVTSLIGFLLGLSLTCPGGIYMYKLIDWFSVSWSVIILALIEVLLIAYVYGQKRFFANMIQMSIRVPKVLKVYWLSMWMCLTPLLLPVFVVTTFIFFSPASYNGYVFPNYVQALGWLMSSTTLVIVLVMGVWEYFRRRSSLTSPKDMFRTTEKWEERYDRESALDNVTKSGKKKKKKGKKHEEHEQENRGFEVDE